MYTSVVTSTQQQLDALADSYTEQQADVSSVLSQEEPNSDLCSCHSSDSPHVGSDSGSYKGYDNYPPYRSK